MIKQRENKTTKRNDFIDLLIEMKKKSEELNTNNGKDVNNDKSSASDEIGNQFDPIKIMTCFTFY
jgi:hypothetical protein